ncbi:Proteolipid membrane potential modulator-like protein 1 [Elsinoe fawcettii]|nr:Proteolipid membrane potential modulator-like protein 1 [Elsinoe fawcettii]
MCGSDIFLGILAIIFPPLPVWVKRGICSADSLINIALCLLGFLPGLLHSWYIIASYPDATYEELEAENERGRVTYYYIQQGQAAQRGYGTVNQGGQPAQNPQGQYASPQHAPLPGSSTQPEQAPPSYQESIQGDNKVQRHD